MVIPRDPPETDFGRKGNEPKPLHTGLPPARFTHVCPVCLHEWWDHKFKSTCPECGTRDHGGDWE
jgi:rubrerythrin